MRSLMTKSIFPIKNVAVYICDNYIQVFYGDKFYEKAFTGHLFEKRVVCNFCKEKKVINSLFRQIIPLKNRLIPSHNIYVAISPLSTEIEVLAMRDIFKAHRFVKNVQLVSSPIATFIGLQCQTSIILVDIDVEYCYISLLINSKIEEAMEMEIDVLKIIQTIKSINDKYSSNNIKDLWLIGMHKDIIKFYNLLQETTNLNIHIPKAPTTATIMGLKAIICQKVYEIKNEAIIACCSNSRNKTINRIYPLKGEKFESIK